jgi:hypothetical protein
MRLSVPKIEKNDSTMKNIIALFFFSILGFNTIGFAQEIKQNVLQKDTAFWTTTPTFVKVSSLVTTQSIGFQASVEKYFIQKEINKIRKSGRIKTIREDRFLSLDLGYYYQAGLHHNWFLTGTYHLRRTGKRGIYAEFSPFVGISRTYISDETYKINSNGGVELSHLAGDWFLTSGFSYGIGKTFNESKSFLLKDIYAKLFLQYMYPNFGFIGFKPSFQIGTSFSLDKWQQRSKKRIKYK